jgi:hypothetical protein
VGGKVDRAGKSLSLEFRLAIRFITSLNTRGEAWIEVGIGQETVSPFSREKRLLIRRWEAQVREEDSSRCILPKLCAILLVAARALSFVAV